MYIAGKQISRYGVYSHSRSLQCLPHMSLLILLLPPGPPGEYVWVRSDNGQRVHSHGAAAAALLPPAGRGVEVVAIAAAQQISWQRASLPRGVGAGSPKLRPTLIGLLEDALLDEPEALHFAVQPQAKGGSDVWVAACQREWLAAHLAALEAAGRPAARIVPEVTPSAAAPQLAACGTPQAPWLLMHGVGVPGGAQALPLAAGTLALLAPEVLAGATLIAEPAAAALTSQLFGRQPILLPASQRLLAQSRSPWDLAQFEFARSGRARTARVLGSAWRSFWHEPRWRPVRWGLAAAALVNLVGLNLSAWQSKADLAARRRAINSTLTTTFPKVRAVSAMPHVQMQREIDALRQATGTPAAAGMEAMLAALADALPDGRAAASLDYANGSLRAGGVQLGADAITAAQERLRPLGYQLSAQSDALLLRPAAEGGMP